MLGDSSQVVVLILIFEFVLLIFFSVSSFELLMLKLKKNILIYSYTKI
jgi:hypothetical protein